MYSRLLIYLSLITILINPSVGITGNRPNEPSYSLDPEVPNEPKKGGTFGKVGKILKEGASRVGKNITREVGGDIGRRIGKGVKSIEGLLGPGFKEGRKGRSSKDRGSKGRGSKGRGSEKGGRDRSGSRDKKKGKGARSERKESGSSGRKSGGKGRKGGKSGRSRK